jgi:hypothetical protein
MSRTRLQCLPTLIVRHEVLQASDTLLLADRVLQPEAAVRAAGWEEGDLTLDECR